jgi:Skp family chaperone for outer membrane proteins
MIISKQNIIMGKNELDITNDILKIIDNKITKVQLK